MKYPVAVATFAIALAVVTGIAKSARAEADAGIPPDGVMCYYHLWTCSYDGDAYWSGCDEGSGGEGWISTFSASKLCDVYHPH